MAEGVETFRVQPGQLIGKDGLVRMLGGWVQPPGMDNAAATSSVYLKPGEAQAFLKTQGDLGAQWLVHLASLKADVLDSETGLVGLKNGPRGLVLAPPFPVPENRIGEPWDHQPLLTLLDADHTIGVVLLRLGRFSAAVFQGRKLLSSKTDSRYVKGRHSAGGTSQKRFSRIREGQIQSIYGSACRAMEAQLTPFVGALDYIVLGGESSTLNGFLKSCPFLQRHRKILQGRRLNVRDPKRDTLEKAGEMLWDSRVWPLDW